MREIDVEEAKTMLAHLVEAAEAGEQVVLTRAGRPVLQLARLPVAGRGIQVGLLKDWLPDSFVESIGEPLPLHDLDEFFGGSVVT